MKSKEGYISIQYLQTKHKEEDAEQWSIEILKIQPFEAIDIRSFAWSTRGVIIEQGSAAVQLNHGYTLRMNGMLVTDFIKYLQKLSEIYGSYEDMVQAVGKEAIQYDESIELNTVLRYK